MVEDEMQTTEVEEDHKVKPQEQLKDISKVEKPEPEKGQEQTNSGIRVDEATLMALIDKYFR